MFAHEKAHEVDVFLGKVHGARPGFEALRSDFLVPAPEALSDVVKEARDEKAPVPVEPRHDVRAEGVFVREVASRKAADVPNDAKRVLIDREDVIEVVLHLPDDVPERQKIAPENPPEVHLLQGVVGAARELQDLEEGFVVLRIVSEVVVDAERRVPEGAQKARRHALQLHVLGKDEEGLEHGARTLFKELRVVDVHFVAAGRKARRDRKNLRARHVAEKAVGERIELQLRHLNDLLGVSVVGLHEALRGAHGAGRQPPEALRERFLQVEDQTVFVALCAKVQVDAKVTEKVVDAVERFDFLFGEKPRLREVSKVGRDVRGLRAPEKDLNVAQAPGALLDVGFERIGGVFVALMAPREFEHLLLKEVLGVELGVKALERMGEKRFVSAQETLFEVGRRNRHVARGLFEKGRFTSHRGAYGEAEIPEFRKEIRNALAERRILRELVLYENEEVDVGIGIELFAPAAAHGDQGESFAREVKEVGERRHRAVERTAVVAQKVARVRGAFVTVDEDFALSAESLDDGGGIGHASAQAGWRRRAFPPVPMVVNGGSAYAVRGKETLGQAEAPFSCLKAVYSA